MRKEKESWRAGITISAITKPKDDFYHPLEDNQHGDLVEKEICVKNTEKKGEKEKKNLRWKINVHQCCTVCCFLRSYQINLFYLNQTFKCK